MPRKKAKKARKPVKYKKITLTVTARQRKSLLNFCKSRRTTPTRVIKKAIRPLLDNYSDLEVNNIHREKVNQLQLF